MSLFLTWLDKYLPMGKVYLAGIGGLGYAVWQFSLGNYQEAYAAFLAALAVIGFRHAGDKQTEQVVQSQQRVQNQLQVLNQIQNQLLVRPGLNPSSTPPQQP